MNNSQKIGRTAEKGILVLVQMMRFFYRCTEHSRNLEALHKSPHVSSRHPGKCQEDCILSCILSPQVTDSFYCLTLKFQEDYSPFGYIINHAKITVVISFPSSQQQLLRHFLSVIRSLNKYLLTPTVDQKYTVNKTN